MSRMIRGVTGMSISAEPAPIAEEPTALEFWDLAHGYSESLQRGHHSTVGRLIELNLKELIRHDVIFGCVEHLHRPCPLDKRLARADNCHGDRPVCSGEPAKSSSKR